MKKILIIFICVMVVISLNALSEVTGKIGVNNKGNIETVIYRYYMPDTDIERALPVMVGVGGLNDDGKMFMNDYWKAFADKNDICILSLGFRFNEKDWPKKRSYQFAHAWSGEALLKILRILDKTEKVDAGALYLFGISAGAQFVTRFSMRYPGICKVVCSHAAGWYDEVEKPVNTKYLITVGELDNDEISRVDFAKSFDLRAKKLGIDVTLHIIPEIGHRHTGAQNKMSQWFIEKELEKNRKEPLYKAMREKMVRAQIKGRGINDKRVLKAMMTVPRHLFVDQRNASSAYGDYALPIGLGQTISQPYIVAFMTEAAQLSKNDRVLEIGTGTGYQAAVLSKIASEVYSVEIIKSLADSARLRLRKLGYDNILIRHGDGYDGWLEFSPYDAIIVTAAPEKIPPKLIEQLKIGGRMIIPVGKKFQELQLIEKGRSGILKRKLLPVRFVPMVKTN